MTKKIRFRGYECTHERKKRLNYVYAQAQTPQGVSASHVDWVREYAEKWDVWYETTSHGASCATLTQDLDYLIDKGLIYCSHIEGGNHREIMFRGVFKVYCEDFLTLPACEGWKERMAKFGLQWAPKLA